MPVRDTSAIDPLLRASCEWLGDDVVWFDAHTHEGQHDPDGMTATAAEVLDGLDAAGHQRALIFPMHEPGGLYGPANDVVRASSAASDGRLRWLARVAPDRDDAVDEVRRCLDLGASGVKLHPRSDAFALPHPAVARIAAEVGERGGVLLFHAGRGIPVLGEAAAGLARQHPRLHVVLAHAGISDLGLLSPIVGELPNLLLDTAWWTIGDLLTMATSIPPGNVVYGSDMPYGPGTIAAFLFARTTRAAGWTAEQARVAAGTQLGRILDGEPPLDLGSAVGPGGLEPRSPALERVVVHAAMATYGAWRGIDPSEPIALARLGCQRAGDIGHDQLLAACDALLAWAESRLAETGDWRECVDAVLAAHALAGTPEAGTPASLPV